MRIENIEFREVPSDPDKYELMQWFRYGQAICDAKFNLSEEICQF